MNANQRRVLIAIAVAIGGMMIYPPFYFPRDGDTGVRHDYGWLWGGYWGRVDVDLLLAQFLAVGIIGLIAYSLYADKKQ